MAIPTRILVATSIDAAARTRVLVDELGIAEDLARSVPEDEPVPPPPGVPAERWAQLTASFAASAPRPASPIP